MIPSRDDDHVTTQSTNKTYPTFCAAINVNSVLFSLRVDSQEYTTNTQQSFLTSWERTAGKKQGRSVLAFQACKKIRKPFPPLRKRLCLNNSAELASRSYSIFSSSKIDLSEKSMYFVLFGVPYFCTVYCTTCYYCCSCGFCLALQSAC